MPLPDLATAADLAAYTQSTVDPDSAAVALRIASAAIRGYTRQDITLVENDTVVLDGGERTLVLPQRPVLVDVEHPLTVVEIAAGGVEVPTVEERDWVRHGSELRRACPGWLQSRTQGWPWSGPLGIWADRVRVTYSHGYTVVPDDVVGVCLDLAAATLTNPARLRSETVGGISQVYTVETFGTGSLTSDHRDILRRYRRTTFSVTAQ